MPKKSKFNARGATVDGIKFDSKLEAECFLHFRAGCEVLNLDLELQPQFDLIPTQRPFKGRTLKKHTYTADFRIAGPWEDMPIEPEHNIVIDVKSPATAEKRDFVINEKLMLEKMGILITRITSPNEAAELMDQLKHA